MLADIWIAMNLVYEKGSPFGGWRSGRYIIESSKQQFANPSSDASQLLAKCSKAYWYNQTTWMYSLSLLFWFARFLNPYHDLSWRDMAWHGMVWPGSLFRYVSGQSRYSCPRVCSCSLTLTNFPNRFTTIVHMYDYHESAFKYSSIYWLAFTLAQNFCKLTLKIFGSHDCD